MSPRKDISVTHAMPPRQDIGVTLLCHQEKTLFVTLLCHQEKTLVLPCYVTKKRHCCYLAMSPRKDTVVSLLCHQDKALVLPCYVTKTRHCCYLAMSPRQPIGVTLLVTKTTHWCYLGLSPRQDIVVTMLCHQDKTLVLPCYATKDKTLLNSSYIKNRHVVILCIEKHMNYNGNLSISFMDLDQNVVKKHLDQKLQSLPYLLMKNVYNDAFILHEESAKSKENEDIQSDLTNQEKADLEADNPNTMDRLFDPRKELDIAWTKFWKFQPLWKIRNYFGEKIALYFAWCGTLIVSLWIPTLFGFAIFLYGLVSRYCYYLQQMWMNVTGNYISASVYHINKLLQTFELLHICLGTVFLEYWKRTNATLAYEWDVNDFESNEPDRPQFYGLKFKQDPVTREETGFIHLNVSLFDVCPGLNAVECLILTSILSSLLNAVSILALGSLPIVIRLRFDSVWGVFGLGTEYTDDCSGSCMSQLSVQVFILMLVKPFPKLFKDIILPLLRRLWRRRPNWCCRCSCSCCCQCCNNKVDQENKDHTSNKKTHLSYINKERMKPSLGDFTLSEYTEKIIQYGFLMLFAASFPLAPLLALLLIAFDIRVDAKRMLWWYRRPVAEIRADIGKWYGILEFVNLCGVISNGFLIAFTSTWGTSFNSTAVQLWIVLGFEHIVFALKFVLAYLVPDVPSEITLAIRREKFQVARILENSKGTEIVDYTELIPKHKKSKRVLKNSELEKNSEIVYRRVRSANYDTFEDVSHQPDTIYEEPEEATYKDKKPLLSDDLTPADFVGARKFAKNSTAVKDSTDNV
ncbi:hypothetical protein KUTeg_002757 [Tegillarca granosa]|uniref:Anoctamin n=1 Tax=Tegillarca granosa TaxID=220873 RepID=A0ABQ9FUQ2_TEGGR|nr:hypothetical protein KUTeg_002757 [Tegillarca granosa]